jgi:hypothetical protein
MPFNCKEFHEFEKQTSPTYAQSNGMSETRTNPQESQGSIYWSDGILQHARYWNDFTIATPDELHKD